jgi:hypothetical protein
MSPSTITVVVPSAEKESVFILQAVRAAIHAYRRGRPKKCLLTETRLINVKTVSGAV